MTDAFDSATNSEPPPSGQNGFPAFESYNAHFVTPYLAVGSRPGPEHVPEMLQCGIRGILNTASFADRAAFAYLHHLPDWMAWKLCGYWDGFLGGGMPGLDEPLTPPYARLIVIRAAEMLRDHQPLLIHCMGGKGRSGNVAAILYAAREGISVDDAIARMREIRPILSPFHHGRFWRNVSAPTMVDLASKVLANPTLDADAIRLLIRDGG